jgi:glycosyltransferase involved in cell wall biosynthesis
MKVLMLSRATLFSAPGGDTVQITSTAKHLQKLGVEVDIRLANDKKIEYAKYDLLHLFNLIRPNDFLYHTTRARKPFVLSTIYVDYSEFEKYNRKGVLKIPFKLLNKYHIEYLKTVARYFVNKEKIVSPEYWWLGQKRAMKRLAKEAAMLLPNSLSELRRLEEDLAIKNRFEIIPNAIDPQKFKLAKASRSREGVICVARIEGLKNQVNLIKALNGSGLSLMIIGKVSPNHKRYAEQCKALAGSNVSFIDHIPQDELLEYYSKAKVHILPSWFETTGLSSLEAAYMGCNIVVSPKGDTQDYFRDMAIYCQPNDINSIRQAVITAYNQPYCNKLRECIEKEYTWEVAAAKTYDAYKNCLTS